MSVAGQPGLICRLLGWFGWRLVRIRGRSMLPLLQEGDHVLLRRYGRSHQPRPGDVACILRADQPLLIKRLGQRSADGRFHLSGDAAASATRIDLGLATEQELMGRAVICLSASGIRRLRSEQPSD